MPKLSILNSNALLDKDLKLTDLRVYGCICMYANTVGQKCFPKQKTIAEKLKTSIPAVSRSIRKLSKKGYIEINSKLYKGRKVQNIYTIKYDISLLENEEKSGITSQDNSVDDGIIPRDNLGITPQDNSIISNNDFNLLTSLTNKEIYKEKKCPKNKKISNKLSKDFRLDNKTIDILTKEGYPHRQIEKTLISFKEYWLEGDGLGKKKKNWQTTFKLWIRKSKAWIDNEQEEVL